MIWKPIDRPEPVTIISNTDVEGASFLQHAHNRLEEFHIYENANANYTGFQASTVFANTDPPLFAVLATWNIGVSLHAIIASRAKFSYIYVFV